MHPTIYPPTHGLQLVATQSCPEGARCMTGTMGNVRQGLCVY